MATRNKLTDLNDHLFTALERLNDEDLEDPQKIEGEVKKAKAIVGISDQIIKSAAITLEAVKMVGSGLDAEFLPESFGIKPQSLLDK